MCPCDRKQAEVGAVPAPLEALLGSGGRLSMRSHFVDLSGHRQLAVVIVVVPYLPLH